MIIVLIKIRYQKHFHAQKNHRQKGKIQNLPLCRNQNRPQPLNEGLVLHHHRLSHQQSCNQPWWNKKYGHHHLDESFSRQLDHRNWTSPQNEKLNPLSWSVPTGPNANHWKGDKFVKFSASGRQLPVCECEILGSLSSKNWAVFRGDWLLLLEKKNNWHGGCDFIEL